MRCFGFRIVQLTINLIVFGPHHFVADCLSGVGIYRNFDPCRKLVHLRFSRSVASVRILLVQVGRKFHTVLLILVEMGKGARLLRLVHFLVAFQAVSVLRLFGCFLWFL